MKARTVYLVLCVVGAIVPYAVFLPWVSAHGLHVPLLIRDVFANRAAGSFVADVLLSSVAFWVFVVIEGRRAGIPRLWVPIAANVIVGLSLGLPLFLYMRERRLELAALR